MSEIYKVGQKSKMLYSRL